MYQIIAPEKNAEILRNASKKMAGMLADMAIAAYQILSERQYVALGFTSVEGFVESPDGPGLSYGAFYQYAAIGALMENAKIEKSEVSSLGFGCALELSRLGKNADDAAIMADDIKKLIARKTKEKLTVPQFKDAVSRLINGEPVEEGKGEGEAEAEAELPANLKRLRKIASTVKTVEDFARIIMSDKAFAPLFAGIAAKK
jgi:hypothetical protein